MASIKKNELAFIIKANRPANIGRIVTAVSCIGKVEAGQKFEWNGEVWRSPITDNIWIIEGNIETLYGSARQAYIPESWLKPIRGDDLDSDSETHSLDKKNSLETI